MISIAHGTCQAMYAVIRLYLSPLICIRRRRALAIGSMGLKHNAERFTIEGLSIYLRRYLLLAFSIKRKVVTAGSAARRVPGNMMA